MFREPVTLCATLNTTGEHIQNVLKLEEAERYLFIRVIIAKQKADSAGTPVLQCLNAIIQSMLSCIKFMTTQQYFSAVLYQFYITSCCELLYLLILILVNHLV